MHRLAYLLALVFALALCLSAYGQEAEEAGEGESAAAEPTEGEEATEAEDDEAAKMEEARAADRMIRMIEIIQALKLQRPQVEALLEIMQAIQVERAAIAKIAGDFSNRAAKRVEDVVEAWVGFEFLAPDAIGAAGRAVFTLTGKMAPHYGRIGELMATAIDPVLDAEQWAGLETRAERLAKLGRTGRLLERKFVHVEDIMGSLETAAKLAPPDFQRRRMEIARNLAAGIVGEESPYLGTITRKMMIVLAEIKKYPADAWQTDRGEIEALVRDQLGLSEADEFDPSEQSGIRPYVVAQSAFEIMLRDPLAIRLFETILGVAGDEPPAEGELEADPIPGAVREGEEQ